MQSDAKELRLLLESILEKISLDRETAIMLSGGLDSSLVACILLSKGKPLRSISASFKGFDMYDETDFILTIKNKYQNLELNLYTPIDIDLLKELKELVKIIKQPITSGSFLLQYLIMKKAKELGIKNLIYCQWPDELFGGYDDFLLHRAHDDLIRFKLKDTLINIKEYILRSKMVNREFVFLKIIFRLIASEGLKSALKKSRENLKNLLDIAYKTAEGLKINLILPYQDLEIIKFSEKLNPDRLVFKGNTKIILREAGEDVLPKEILNRRKKFGFFAPDSIWFLKNKEAILKINNSKVQKEYKRFLKNPYRRWHISLWYSLSSYLLNQI